MRVLVLGAGGAAANGFTRALRMAGGYRLIGTNCDRYDLELAETDEKWLLPRASEDSYAHELLRLAERIRPDLVHAQADIEVKHLSDLRSLLPVFLPSEATIEVCQNKWLSHLRWRDQVAQPDTRMIFKLEDLKQMMDWHGRVWLRHIHGAGGNGSIATDDPALGKAWLDHQNGWGWFTAAEVLEGPTVTWQSIWWEGVLIVAQARKRLSWANARNAPSGVSGSTGVGETVDNPSLDVVAQLAIRAIDAKPHGIWGVDCIQAGETFCPTEINIGRFFTTVPEFYARIGLNMPDIYCRLFFDEEDVVTTVFPGLSGHRWIRGMDTEPVCLSPP